MPGSFYCVHNPEGDIMRRVHEDILRLDKESCVDRVPLMLHWNGLGVANVLPSSNLGQHALVRSLHDT